MTGVNGARLTRKAAAEHLRSATAAECDRAAYALTTAAACAALAARCIRARQADLAAMWLGRMRVQLALAESRYHEAQTMINQGDFA